MMVAKQQILKKLSDRWNKKIFLGIFLIGFGIISWIFDYYFNPFYFSPSKGLTYYTLTIIIFLGILIVFVALLKPEKRKHEEPEKKESYEKGHDFEHLLEKYMGKALYERLAAEFRVFEREVWEVPTITFTVSGILLAVAYEYIKQPEPRIVLLLLTFMFNLGMLITMAKHRLFHAYRANYLLLLEEKSGIYEKLQIPSFEAPTDKAIEFLQKQKQWEGVKSFIPEWFFHQKALPVVWLILLIFSIIILFLFFYEFTSYIGILKAFNT